MLAVGGLVVMLGTTATTLTPRSNHPAAGHATTATRTNIQPVHTQAAATSPVQFPATADVRGIPHERWTRLTAAPSARTEVAAARVGDAAYIVGGFDTSARSSDVVERLDLRTGKWSRSTPLPHPLNHMSVVARGTSLYVLGGYSGESDTSSGATAAFWRFDTVGHTWQRMPDAPLPRAAAGAAVLGERLYVVGGRNDAQPTIGELDVFDFATGVWTSGPALQHPREHVAAVAADGSIYVLGGRVLGAGTFADVERYEPGAKRWQVVAKMPVARAGFEAVAVGSRVVVVGGEDATETVTEVDALNTDTGRWRRLAPMLTPRHGLGVVAAGPLVWAIDGGQQAGLTTSNVVERLRL